MITRKLHEVAAFSQPFSLITPISCSRPRLQREARVQYSTHIDDAQTDDRPSTSDITELNSANQRTKPLNTTLD